MATGPVPPLEQGDHLNRGEFERRYEAMPDLKKAELIDGVVFLTRRVKLREHGQPHAAVATWLGVYMAATPTVLAANAATVRLDWDNEVQPDVLLMIRPERGGQARIGAEGFVEGAPELVAEVATSGVSIDLHAKLDVYRRSGVREYVTWRVLDGTIDWRVNRGGVFELLAPDADGLMQSEVFPGLRLDPAAMVRGDLARVLDRLRQGLGTAEHLAFLERPAPDA